MTTVKFYHSTLGIMDCVDGDVYSDSVCHSTLSMMDCVDGDYCSDSVYQSTLDMMDSVDGDYGQILSIILHLV